MLGLRESSAYPDRSFVSASAPSSEQILFDEAGVQYSAIDDRLWPPGTQDLLSECEALHEIVQSVSSNLIYALYSTRTPTERAYLIDSAHAVRDICSPLVKGDGTVNIASASGATEEKIADR